MPLPSLPTWSQTKHGSKVGFDKVFNVVDKLGAPVNKLSNKLGSEAFWPTTLDKESDKAARILRSFCKEGFYVEEEKDGLTPRDGIPKGKQRVIKSIPTEVIRKAKGLAIFTTMRTGLWISGAGGSGVLVARKADGEWSPPSGILLHTAGLGFLIGVDIYDCVVVINTDKALEAFTKIRATIGGEVSAVAGPVGMGGIMETELVKRQAPVWNYLKSRGFYAGVQIDGTVIIERQDENERFYGQKMTVAEILAGKTRHPPPEIKTLMATIKAAQGENVDEGALPSAEPTPGDYEVTSEGGVSRFGLPPSEDDPDPYGVKALEEEGMEIKEVKPSGHKTRPSMDAFEYKPAPSSPIFKDFDSRGSWAKGHRRDSSRLSVSSIDRATQTELPPTPRFPESPRDSGHHSPVKKTSENLAEEELDGEDLTNQDLQEEGQEEHHEEPVIISKAKVVTIPKRAPPTLPPRSPYRATKTDSVNSTDTPTSATPSGLGIMDASHGTPSLSHPEGYETTHAPPPKMPTNAMIREHTMIKEVPSSMPPLPIENPDHHSQDLTTVPLHQDPALLSPAQHAGFDDVSISGSSDYDKGTPAETPIKLEDNEKTDGLAVGGNAEEAKALSEKMPREKDDEQLKKGHIGLGLDTNVEKEVEDPKSGTVGLGLIPGAPRDDDADAEGEFHSIPSTPPERSQEPLGGKEDELEAAPAHLGEGGAGKDGSS